MGSLVYPGHISHWESKFKSCSSYYRIRDLETGVVLRNLTESCNHSFGSAFVDTHKNGTETLWVVGSSWYRPATTAASPAEGTEGLLGQRGDEDLGRSGEGWGGTCKNGTACVVGSYSTTDPTLQDWQVIFSVLRTTDCH
jgi:hypothetical protein